MDNSAHTPHLDNGQTPGQENAECVYSQCDLWYFKTREGDEVGPFRYRSEAESNLDRFIAQLKDRI